MAFPTVPTAGANTLLQSSQSTATTTHTFPSLTTLDNAAGDLLLAIIVKYDGANTNAEFSSWGGGFTEFVDQAQSGTNVPGAIGAAYKFSDGTETGTFTVTSAGSHRSVMFLLSIKGAHASTPPEATARATGTSAAADPAALSPSWGAKDTLWIAVANNDETSLTGSFTGITAAPTNYTGYVDSGIIGGDVIGALEGAVAFRQTNTASENVGGFTLDVGAAANSALLIAVSPVAGQTVNLGLVSETETSQAVTFDRGLNLGLISEAESAQLVPSAWVNTATWDNAMPWNHPTLEPRKVVVLGLVTETETAQPVTVQTGGGQTVPVGLVTETETSQSVTIRKTSVLGQPAETESSRTVTIREIVTVGQSTETETSQSVTIRKTSALGQPAETESSRNVTVRKAVLLGQPVETEIAQAISAGGQTTVPFGQVAETESARAVTLRKIVKLDDFYSDVYSEHYFSPVEREIPQPVTLRLTRVLGQPSETESAQVITPTGPATVVLEQVVETESARPVTLRLTRNLGQPSETETARAVAVSRGVSLGQIIEIEQAQALGVIGGAPIFTPGSARVGVAPLATGTATVSAQGEAEFVLAGSGVSGVSGG